MMVGIFSYFNSICKVYWKIPFRLINSLLQFLITGKAFNFWGQIEDETMIVHCLESGSIGFEIPFFPLPSRKISWAMEMYNPNVNPYRNTHPNCTKHLQKAGGVFCTRNKFEDPGDFSA